MITVVRQHWIAQNEIGNGIVDLARNDDDSIDREATILYTYNQDDYSSMVTLDSTK